VSQPTEIHTLAGAYALDALTEIERAAFARHIASCEACAAEVAELTETASRLGVAAALAPPSRMRDAVLAQVSQTPQVAPGRVDRAPYREAQVWRRWTAAAVAAGVIALGGIGTVWVVQNNRVSDARAQTQALESLISAGDLKVRQGTVAGGGRVTVAISPSRNQGVMVMSDLPTPPDGKVYQLWLIRNNDATSAGVMAAGQSSGTATLSNVSGADTFGVTIEPVGGSAQPTMSQLVAGIPLA
jgi:anti-sigma-K factor RskA